MMSFTNRKKKLKRIFADSCKCNQSIMTSLPYTPRPGYRDAVKRCKDAKVPIDVLSEILNEKIRKQIDVLMKLTVIAWEKKDVELFEKMGRKRKDICEQLMSNIDDASGNVNDNQYLELCNLMKVMF